MSTKTFMPIKIIMADAWGSASGIDIGGSDGGGGGGV